MLCKMHFEDLERIDSFKLSFLNIFFFLFFKHLDYRVMSHTEYEIPDLLQISFVENQNLENFTKVRLHDTTKYKSLLI